MWVGTGACALGLTGTVHVDSLAHVESTQAAAGRSAMCCALGGRGLI
jgi:hypothetical protein